MHVVNGVLKASSKMEWQISAHKQKAVEFTRRLTGVVEKVQVIAESCTDLLQKVCLYMSNKIICIINKKLTFKCYPFCFNTVG